MKHFIPTLALLGLVACGVKSKTDANGMSSEDESSSLLSYPTCADELRLNDIPSGWLEVPATELITNQKEYYQLIRVRALFQTSLDGHPITIATDTTLENGVAKSNEVICENLMSGEFLNFHIPAALNISQKDGNLYRADRKDAQLMKLNFELKDGLMKETYVTKVKLKSASEQGLKSAEPLVFLNTKDTKVKFFTLFDRQLEVRKKELLQVNGIPTEISTILRYRPLK